MVQLRPVLDNETANAGELVVLWWQNDDVEVEFGQVRATKLKSTGVVGIFGVDNARQFVGNAFLESFNALGIVVCFARCVVVGGHYLFRSSLGAHM